MRITFSMLHSPLNLLFEPCHGPDFHCRRLAYEYLLIGLLYPVRYHAAVKSPGENAETALQITIMCGASVCHWRMSPRIPAQRSPIT